MFRVVHVGKLYKVAKNVSGYLLWIPGNLADELNLKKGDEVILMTDGRVIVVVPSRLEVGLGEVQDT